MELNLQIRSEFRGPLPSSGEQQQGTDSEAEICKPVKSSGVFAEPTATQALPLPRAADPGSGPAEVVEAAHEPVELVTLSALEVPDDDAGPEEEPLTLAKLPPDSELFKKVLGKDNVMIFPDKFFRDRLLVQKVLLSGQSRFKWARIVDLYHHVDTSRGDNKRRKIPPVSGPGRNRLRAWFFSALKYIFSFNHCAVVAGARCLDNSF